MSARDGDIVELKPSQHLTNVTADGWDQSSSTPLHRALGQLLAEERIRFERKTRAFELKLAELTGALDVLRGAAPPPPAKFPSVKTWKEDTIYHEGDIVAFAGGTYQAQRDTARAPWTEDWVQLASPGAPGKSPVMRGTYNAATEYSQLDVVALDGSSFIALRNQPGACPGANWQLVASCGCRGQHGEHGRLTTIVSWQIDRDTYIATPVMDDGSEGAPLQLRELFHRGHLDTEREVLIESLGEALGLARRQLLDQIEPQLRKINALELKLAELAGAIDILRGAAPPPPAKFPSVQSWTEDAVYHTGDVVAFGGGTYQATKDTARAPSAKDWVCLASPGSSLTVRGTYDTTVAYRYLDVAMVNGSSFVALKDNPGLCPGEDWQLLASRGSRGSRGAEGARGSMGLRGERGAAAPTIRDWVINRERYTATPIMSDGSLGSSLELRALFEQFLQEMSK